MTSRSLLLLRSLLFNIAFFGWSALAALLFLPLFIVPARQTALAGREWARGTLWLARMICGIRHEIRGREHMAAQPVIYASKHQSAWDTAIFLLLLPWPAYVLKRELLRIPLWGWYLWRMKMIAIDRSAGGASIKRMVRRSKEALAEGRSIIIYPEGTRTSPGASPQYHPGVVALYNQLEVPVVPVALNSGCYWGKNAFLKRPGTIVLEFLPPIPPGLDKKQFAQTLQDRIETASHKLLQEATLASNRWR